MKFRNKTITVIMAVICILTAFSFSVSANATADTANDETTDLSVNDSVESKTPLSPKGNMTSIDDVHQITDTSDKNTIEDKQFITVESKNGNVFYIIIDRSGDTDNVYFLNAVDEADLMALMEDEQKAEITAVCICVDKCELGAVNKNCAVCFKNITKCIGVETVTEEKDKEAKEEPKQSGSPLAGLIILALLGGGGAFYWFKIKNKKPSTKGTTDPTDYEEDDEDDTDYETETDSENEDDAEPDEGYEYDDEDMDEADESEDEE